MPVVWISRLPTDAFATSNLKDFQVGSTLNSKLVSRQRFYWVADSEVALYLYSGPPFQGSFRLKIGPFSAPLHTPAPPEAAARRLIYRKLLGFRTLSPRSPGVGADRAARSPPHPPKGRWPLPTVDSGALPASQPLAPCHGDQRSVHAGHCQRRGHRQSQWQIEAFWTSASSLLKAEGAPLNVQLEVTARPAAALPAVPLSD